MAKVVNSRAFLGNTFPGDESASGFDKLDRIQKLMIIDTTADIVDSWETKNYP